MSFRLLNLASAALVLAVIFAPMQAYAADERMQDAVEARQGLLKVVRAYFGPMVAMARGNIPYDGDRMKEHAHKVRELSQMIPYLFRTDTRKAGVASGSLDGIWEDWEDFEAKAQALTEAAAALEAATAEGQGAAMAAFRRTGGACKGCHDEYREQD